MLYISVRPERYSYGIIRETGEFVVNLTTEKLARGHGLTVEYVQDRDVDKFKEMHLTEEPSVQISAPGIAECPVNIECRVEERTGAWLPSHVSG